MLRKIGFTPNQLREQFETISHLNYDEKNFELLFGKPPYEFIDLDTRIDFPAYKNFFPQFIDQNGLQYQKTDEENIFFVRIPISITRNYNKLSNNKTYEDYVTFPKSGDVLTMVSRNEIIEAEVDSCPYEFKRAVSRIYFRYVNKIDFVADLIDTKGRIISVCNRNKDCFVDEKIDLNSIDLSQLEEDFFYTIPLTNQMVEQIKHEFENIDEDFETLLDITNESHNNDNDNENHHTKRRKKTNETNNNNTNKIKTTNNNNNDDDDNENDDNDNIKNDDNNNIEKIDKDEDIDDKISTKTIKIKSIKSNLTSSTEKKNEKTYKDHLIRFFIDNSRPYEKRKPNTKQQQQKLKKIPQNIYDSVCKKIENHITSKKIHSEPHQKIHHYKKGETIKCYQLYGDRMLELEVCDVKSCAPMNDLGIIRLKIKK